MLTSDSEVGARDASNICDDTPKQFDRRSKHGITLYDSDNEEERKHTKRELQECKYFVAVFQHLLPVLKIDLHNLGLSVGSDFSYLSESSSGDGFTGTRTGEETSLFRNLQSTISSVKSRGTERSINEVHSPLDERVCSHSEPHLCEISTSYRQEHPVNLSAIHTSYTPEQGSRWGSRVGKMETLYLKG